MFMVFLELLLDTLYSKDANDRIPKDIGHYQHVGTKNPQGYPSFQWCGLILSMFHIRFCLYYGPHHQTPLKNQNI